MSKKHEKNTNERELSPFQQSLIEIEEMMLLMKGLAVRKSNASHEFGRPVVLTSTVGEMM